MHALWCISLSVQEIVSVSYSSSCKVYNVVRYLFINMFNQHLFQDSMRKCLNLKLKCNDRLTN